MARQNNDQFTLNPDATEFIPKGKSRKKKSSSEEPRRWAFTYAQAVAKRGRTDQKSSSLLLLDCKKNCIKVKETVSVAAMYPESSCSSFNYEENDRSRPAVPMEMGKSNDESFWRFTFSSAPLREPEQSRVLPFLTPTKNEIGKQLLAELISCVLEEPAHTIAQEVEDQLESLPTHAMETTRAVPATAVNHNSLESVSSGKNDETSLRRETDTFLCLDLADLFSRPAPYTQTDMQQGPESLAEALASLSSDHGFTDDDGSGIVWELTGSDDALETENDIYGLYKAIMYSQDSGYYLVM